MTVHEPGTELAGYRIESLIGRGGMAVVYRAEDMRLGRKVALKLLPPQLADSEQFRQRFMRESRLAASLDHPNIVPVYEAGEADGQLFIAMRYVIGSDMKAVLADEGALPVSRTLRLYTQIGDALDAAHRAGLVHRDVKPANVLVVAGPEHTRHAQGDHVYLTDFGLTKRTSELSGGLTGTGHFLGTVDYVAPEQIQGRPVGPGTDIYALGCMLYECLTGQLPFRRDDDAALLWAHLVETPPPVTAIRRELPGAVNAVVARAMAKDAADRYGSCEELLRELELALGMPASVSSPHGGPTRDSGSAAPRTGALSDSSRAEPGTVTGDLPGGSRHPSFPSGSHLQLPPTARASYDSVPTADHHPDFEDDRTSYADWDDDPGPEWDDPGPDWDDDSGRDRDPGVPVAPAAPPAVSRRRLLIALVAAAVVLVAGAGLLLRSTWFAEDYRQFTSSGTVVRFELEHPADWGTQGAATSDLLLGPDPSAADDLFFDEPQSWAAMTDVLRAGSPDDAWLFVKASTATYDTAGSDALAAQVVPLLPQDTRFESGPREVQVAGAPAVEVEAVASDPLDPRTSLRMLVDVVQPPGANGALLLVFAAPPDTFDEHRPTFERIRDSLRITP